MRLINTMNAKKLLRKLLSKEQLQEMMKPKKILYSINLILIA